MYLSFRPRSVQATQVRRVPTHFRRTGAQSCQLVNGRLDLPKGFLLRHALVDRAGRVGNLSETVNGGRARQLMSQPCQEFEISLAEGLLNEPRPGGQFHGKRLRKVACRIFGLWRGRSRLQRAAEMAAPQKERQRRQAKVCGRIQHSDAFERPGANRQSEGAALAGVAQHLNVAAEHVGQPLRDGQPKPRAAEAAGRRGIGLSERLEQVDDFVRRNANAGVGNHEPHEWCVVVRRLQSRASRTPPWAVNLIALPTRFIRICRKRTGSVRIVSGTGER